MKHKYSFISVLSAILVLICLIPFLYLFYCSFVSNQELTLSGYYQVLLGSSEYLLRFWKSLGLSVLIAFGQVTASILAGFSFAKFQFRGKSFLFFFLMILMVLPLQVTLVPNYLILDELGLLNTQWALILPAVFIPLGTFIMTQAFEAIPNEILDAAYIDGCGLFRTLWHVACPMSKGGAVCVLLLSFLDAWNMVEQPIAYLKDPSSYPISVALATSPPSHAVYLTVCAVLVILPPLFLFLYFNKELIKGIIPGGLKG